MTNRLFIIGNGFDLHHGILSDYSEFGSYLERVDPETFSIAEQYVVPEKNLWSCLEERFAEIDVDQIQDYAANFLVSYGADDWSDSGHHDYEYEIDKICSAISSNIRQNFADWVRQLDIPTNDASPVQCIDPSALFLNFNYTATVQLIYSIPDGRVLHIHGAASDPSSEIVLGHGWERQAADLLSHNTNEETDVRVAGGSQLIDDHLAKTFKPTQEILWQNRAFFTDLSSTTEVFVLGHSLAGIDRGYFSAVLDHVHPDADWTVSYYASEDATQTAAENIGIPTSRLQLKLLQDM